jgi:hypothetical protein
MSHIVCSSVPERASPQALGVVRVPEENHALENKAQEDKAQENRAQENRARANRTEPSWGRVLANTVQLGVSRRFGGSARGRWRLIALVLVLAFGAGAALGFTGMFNGSKGQVSARMAARSTPSDDPAATVKSQAAAWVAAQVAANVVIACFPDMCSALEAHGVSAGRLMPLSSGGTAMPAASVLVTSPSGSDPALDRSAPGLIASFGPAGTRVEVRVVSSGGATAYQSALATDLTARKVAGPQLLNNRHLRFTAADTAELNTGEVDSRLLLLLATLAPQHMLRVVSFGDAAPGAPLLYRQVTLTSTGSGGAADLNGALAIVRAQTSPYAPAHATVVSLAGGQSALSIEFATPGPLGLLAGAVP